MPRLTPTRVRLGILAGGVLLLVLYDLSGMVIADGRIIYRVRLTSAVPIREAGAEVYSRPERAEDDAHDRSPAGLEYRLPPEALAGEPFEVRAWFTIRVGSLGIRHSRVQQTGLLIVAVQSDGRRVAKVVELPEPDPHRKSDPEVTVALD
ncbi:hypothetical protein [Urbifossiella limnaea]|uniref:Uncharacterized protein n=1 Tax=Urbifossiella limnaea TaxID=2528023 RepID=A0A517Y3I8_9BACT|nr:hypothetical protein [Urbifossiella limnaea]QDU24278.1 hypothetical protein ETAA1_62920 [Urbifossiella limnaea]